MKPLISNVEVFGLERSVKTAKYPMSIDVDALNSEVTDGINKLAQSGSGEGHDQFLTGITVYFDLTCSNKMWVEAERYNYLEFISSQSTMHRIARMNLDDDAFSPYVLTDVKETFKSIVNIYNENAAKGVDQEELKEQYLTVLYNCPAGLRLTAGMVTNYRQLKTIYKQRKNHRLPEWKEFCAWIKTLPYSDWITGE